MSRYVNFDQAKSLFLELLVDYLQAREYMQTPESEIASEGHDWDKAFNALPAVDFPEPKSNKLVLGQDAAFGIKEHCAKRNYRCSTCAFSIKKYCEPKHKGSTCIFGNCPCGWGDEDIVSNTF